jgi:hypothetical protein
MSADLMTNRAVPERLLSNSPELLIAAFDGSTRGKPQRLVDGGIENYNRAVAPRAKPSS